MSSLCSFGQVGIGTTSDVLSPIELKALRSQGVKFVACGDEHTALLTQVRLCVGMVERGVCEKGVTVQHVPPHCYGCTVQ